MNCPATASSEPVSHDEYHDRPEISRSQLSDFAQSRRLYQMRYVTKSTPPWSRQSEAVCLRDGTNIHTAVLMPHLFDDLVRVVPDRVLTSNGQARGNRYNDWLDDQREECPDVIAVKRQQLDELQAIADAVHTETGNMLANTKAIVEQPIFWTESGLQFRAMPDWLIQLPDESFMAIDLKSCRDATEDGFRRACLNHRYWLQDAHYSVGVEYEHCFEVSRFLFVAVEKEPPYLCRAYELDPVTRADARQRREELITDLNECYASDDWSDPGEGTVTSLSLIL